MSTCVFIGPTIRREEVLAICEAECLPPVAQGDVYRAVERGARVVGIVDGYFSGAPSVWHKEILWALSKGVRVFGSASMGALRAAELHRHGMRGVGRIFEAFRDGILEDDDEVAVVHGPAELGFVPASEPMVNIRATLERAAAEGILGEPSRARLEEVGKSLFFPQRAWPQIVAGARETGVTEAELKALEAWLPRGRVDQKREDAVAMLRAMQEPLDAPTQPNRFEWTHFWDEMVAQSSGGAQAEPGRRDDRQREIVEELRLEGGAAYKRAELGALLRLLGGREADRRGLDATTEALRAALQRLRQDRGLFVREGLEAWMRQNDLDDDSLERLLREQVRLKSVSDLSAGSLAARLIDELRVSGDYERLAARAAEKRTAISAEATFPPQGTARMHLRHWYFAERAHEPMPDDIEAFARGLGFADLAEFDGALWREWLYLHPKA